ncbi:MAG TPA: hypothetical protein VJA44_05795 [Acidimicrobiia bacterium]|nr:hypothetical protein [Acidimicrobiia bacterium]
MTASVTNLRLETARFALLRVEESTDERRAEVRVMLVWEGKEHVGVAAGTPADSERPSLVAAATLNALAFIDDEYRLIDTSTSWAGGLDVAMVVVEDPEGDRPLIGTAVLDDDNRQVAFAKAALDAVNRRIAPSL